MSALSIAIFIAFFIALISAQSLKEATWVGGSNSTDQPGDYNNSLAAIGSRADAASWVDGQQTWIFGGFGYGSRADPTTEFEAGLLNDLWKYTDSWWYVNGSTTTEPPEVPPVVVTYPGARKNAAYWKAQGQLWLFGGFGYDIAYEEGVLNDLWAYDTSSGIWTLKSGSQLVNVPPQYNATLPVPPFNVSTPANPGSRECAFTWVVHGENGAATLWLYGGVTAEEAGYHNDIWTYDLTTNNWTWVAGTNGTEGGEIPASKRALPTSPSPRSCGASWVGPDGGLYLFGGHYTNETFERTTAHNDIWKYNTTTYQWTLVQQDTPAGVYNNTANDRPAPRYSPAFTHDSRGNLYIFGGKIPLIDEGADTRNDLWVYYSAKNEWKWLLGSALPNASESLNVTTRKGVPGARAGASLWIDAQERLWLFGGSNNTEEDFGFRNDLWILIEDVDPTPPTTSTGDATTGGLTTGAATGNVTTGVTTNDATTGSVTTNGATTGSATTGAVTTGVPTGNATTGSTANTTGDSLTTGHQTSGTSTTTSQSLTSGSSTAVITTGVPATTSANATITTTGAPHSGGVSTGVIIGSVFGGGITISAGVVGVLLWRGNLRVRNIFRREENEEANELLPLNRKRVINSV